MISTHGLVAGKRILECSRQNVMYARPAIGRRRTLIESKKRPSLGSLKRFFKYIFVPPEFKYFLLQRGAVVTAGDFLKTHLSEIQFSKQKRQTKRPERITASGAIEFLNRGTTRFYESLHLRLNCA